MRMDEMQGIKLRSCMPADVEGIVQFVASCPPLDLHTSFTYWVTFKYWGDLCFVALMGERIVGYASAIGSGRDDATLYLWQVGVVDELRSSGLAQRLIESVADAGGQHGFRKLEVSIASDNEASLRAFSRFAASLGQSLDRCGEVSFEEASGKSVREDIYALNIV
jgi:L-2,4-diaminobutyric acid acetyltransferase